MLRRNRLGLWRAAATRGAECHAYWKIMAVVFGALDVLVGVALIGVLAEDRDDDGLYIADEYPFDWSSYAIVPEDLDNLTDVLGLVIDLLADPVDLQLEGTSGAGGSLHLDRCRDKRRRFRSVDADLMFGAKISNIRIVAPIVLGFGVLFLLAAGYLLCVGLRRLGRFEPSDGVVNLRDETHPGRGPTSGGETSDQCLRGSDHKPFDGKGRETRVDVLVVVGTTRYGLAAGSHGPGSVPGRVALEPAASPSCHFGKGCARFGAGHRQSARSCAAERQSSPVPTINPPRHLAEPLSMQEQAMSGKKLRTAPGLLTRSRFTPWPLAQTRSLTIINRRKETRRYKE